jgi:predicted dehydrogenase
MLTDPPQTVKIGVIGCGEWGPNHIRNFSSLSDSTVVACSDLDLQRLSDVKARYPHLRTTASYEDLLASDVDAVVVATPTSTHYEVVKTALLAGKHVLCEKPLCTDAAEGVELVRLAEDRARVLMVGHVFMFNVGIQKLKEYLQKGALGQIYYLHSTRTNLGPIRQDVNVVWDLASHDISIFLYLLETLPVRVSAMGQAFIRSGQKTIEDVAFASLEYPDRISAHVHVSWLSPRKVRELTVVGDIRMAVWNDLSPSEPLRLYEKGVTRRHYTDFGEFHTLLRDGDIHIPKLDLIEPLRLQSSHFLQAVRQRTRPISDGASGVKVVRVLAAIERSLQMHGAPIDVS